MSNNLEAPGSEMPSKELLSYGLEAFERKDLNAALTSLE